MTLTYSPVIISESTNGLGILVTATESPGTLIHTVNVTGTDHREEIRILAYNASTASQPIQIEWGATDLNTRSFKMLVGRDVPANIQPATFLNLTATTSQIRIFTGLLYSSASFISSVAKGSTNPS